MTKREIIKKYLGVPFGYKGRSLTSVDCYGLVVLIYKDLGFALPDYEYEDKWYDNGKNYYVDNYYELWEKVTDLKEWDAILFKNRSTVVNHVGLYLGENQFIHCYVNSSVEISDLTRKYWDRCKSQYFRYKGL